MNITHLRELVTRIQVIDVSIFYWVNKFTFQTLLLKQVAVKLIRRSGLCHKMWMVAPAPGFEARTCRMRDGLTNYWATAVVKWMKISCLLGIFSTRDKESQPCAPASFSCLLRAFYVTQSYVECTFSTTFPPSQSNRLIFLIIRWSYSPFWGHLTEFLCPFKCVKISFQEEAAYVSYGIEAHE